MVKGGREMAGLAYVAWNHDQHSFHKIPQFANIARPAVVRKRVKRRLGKVFRSAAIRSGKFRKEVLSQNGNILGVLAKGWYEEGDHIKPIEKVLAKISL